MACYRLLRFRFLFILVLAGCGWFMLPGPSGADNPPAQLQIQPGDHITIIGNRLAERMQHDGWLETYFQTRFPGHKLVFRNLGFTGDTLTVRDRSDQFGSPDQWLKHTKTDIVFAFFGYNESYAGVEGLPKFKKDLKNFIEHTRSQKYNGRHNARLVLFAPIAHEDLRDPNLPDGTANNKRLALYTAAMAEVARAGHVPFVNLFAASQQLYAKSREPLTINGVHLNERGNNLIALAIDQALFPGAEVQRDAQTMDKVRRAVVGKNFYWFNRYRTVDGYNVFGGRADLRYTDGISNRDVMQREMQILDVMTANRDARVWAAAQGRDYQVRDDNTPPFIPVKTNKPGPLPGGKHIILDGQEAIKKMTIAKGMKINLFASEKEFPDLVNPVQMAWDMKGRLWVAVWPSYPHWKPKEDMNDKLLILEDTDGDGKADKKTVFADHLHCPTGFEFYNGGVLVGQAPDIMFLKDTDGDDKADVRVRVLGSVDSADTHHTANSFTFDPGGALYFQEGVFHHSQLESPWTTTQRCVNAGVFRFEPRTYKVEVYVNFGFANPHGHVFDRWGQDIVVDGTGANPYHATLFSGQTDFPQRHPHPPQVYRQRTRPCPGIEVLSSRHFPESLQGNLLVANVIVPSQGILQYKIKDKGASFAGVEIEPIVTSSDPNFRPADIEIGPDGAIYFTDWHNPIIGHMQHHIRDPNRGREHGRVYRVTYEGRPLLKPARIAGASIPALLDLLKEPEDRVRYRARIELGARDTRAVLAALEKWIGSLDRTGPDYEHQMLEALWLYQRHNTINEGLLRRMLRSPDFRARAAATRVLCYWRERVNDPLFLLQEQIHDPHPRVRLEAIRALSFFHDERALAIALEMLTHPEDEYLHYTFNETLTTLERRLGGARLDRQNIAAGLLKMLDKGRIAPQQKAVLIETVCRHGGPTELKIVWDKVAGREGSSDLRRRALDWLAEAARTRRMQPTVNADAFRRFLNDVGRDPVLLPAAIHLAAAWKIKDAAGDLRRIAASQGSLEARFAAIDALAELRDTDTLRDLTAMPHALAIRFRSSAALAQTDLKAGARAAAMALSQATAQDDPAYLIESFLERKNGSDALADALAGQKISADTAKRILRAMYLAGRNDARLGNVASRFAGLDAAPAIPTPDMVRKLAAEAMGKGDPIQGERVFRRADLGCIKCHAINKSGGRVGPDLGPIGSSSPIDYVITSILDPNASVKEEYLTRTIVTDAGKIYTGIVLERGKNRVVLKDATGKRVVIPAADIEQEAAGKTLMPEGITRILTHDELLHLIRFVSELGKPGPFAAPAYPTILRWQRLRKVASALAEGIPNRDILRDAVLRSRPEDWDTVHAQVNGRLPLDELRSQKNEVLYVQGEIRVVQAGAIEFRLDSSGQACFWVDEQPFENQSRAVVQLAPGRHRITVRVALEHVKNASYLKMEVVKPADSRALFEVVQGE
jgi:putative heme-binding domain-containing protein